MDLLWRIILTARDEGVARRATNNLMFYTFQLIPGAQIKDHLVDEHINFMKTCMLTLHSIGEDTAKTVRCLKVITQCTRLSMNEAKESGLLKGPAQPHGYLGLGTLIRVNIILNGGGKWYQGAVATKGYQKLFVEVMSNDKLGVLRRKVMERFMKEMVDAVSTNDSNVANYAQKREDESGYVSDNEVMVVEAVGGKESIVENVSPQFKDSKGKLRDNAPEKTFPKQTVAEFSASYRIMYAGKELKDDSLPLVL